MATGEDEKELPPEEELLGETEAVDEKEKDDDLEQEGEDRRFASFTTERVILHICQLEGRIIT